MSFKEKYNVWLEQVNNRLDELVVEKDTPEKTVYSAMRYSLMAGGKRLRPVLSLAVCDLFNKDAEDVLNYACAIEMIHTYSLIHDDLPAMDNDDYRRGRLTNHKVYGEAQAILAGDALLNYAFEVMLEDALKKPENLKNKVKAMEMIARASGVYGMIGGQIVDLESEGREIPSGTLEYMHRYKTGAIIKASVLSAAVISGANDGGLKALDEYAEKIGLAFQIKDDILDIVGNSEKMGKKTGSDTANKKSTYVTLYGIDKSRQMLNDITGQAINSLTRFGERGEFLKNLAEYLASREN